MAATGPAMAATTAAITATTSTSASTHLDTLKNTVANEAPRRNELHQQADLLWQTPALAKEYAALSHRHTTYDRIQSDTADLVEMQLLDDTTPQEKTWIDTQLTQLEEELQLIVRALLFQGIDCNNCWLELSAGAGGDDAMDFTEMLTKMYTTWGSNYGFKVTLEDATSGEIAGYRKARLYVQGEASYGWLLGETGIHRLVRNSPFNKTNTRETSFARVEVIPQVVEDEVEAEVLLSIKGDVEIQTYKASGAGGQSVNTTDSAVRMIHVPTGTTVTSSKERSQHANRKHCKSLLLGKLKRLHAIEKEKDMQEKHANYEGESLLWCWECGVGNVFFWNKVVERL